MPLRYGLIEPAELAVPRLPRALEGLRVAHVSDLHIRGPRRMHTRLLTQLTSMRLDLVMFTGDYMDQPGNEEAAIDFLQRLLEKLRPRIGCFGVFGNHDSPAFIRRAYDLPLTWLDGQVHDDPQRPLRIMGVCGASNKKPDFAQLALATDRWDHHPQTHEGQSSAQPAPRDSPTRPLVADKSRRPNEPPPPPGKQKSPTSREPQRPLHLLMCHWPNRIALASRLDADLMLAGHSHGGQFRLPTGQVVFNGTKELPLKMTSGLLRCRNTLGATSRGLGNSNLDFRLLCPPHVPVYTLRRRTAPGHGDQRIERLWFW